MRTRLFVLFISALGLAGCPSPPPFDPGSECPKLPNCGQCASRGGCAWCGNQCVAVGHTSCTGAPVTTPGNCPPPAADAGP